MNNNSGQINFGFWIRKRFQENQPLGLTNSYPIQNLKSKLVVHTVQHWNETTREVQFYIISLASDADKIGSAIRQHWGIENSAHWTLDVTFHEDESRIRSLHSPQNFGVHRRIALNAIKVRNSF